MIPTVVLGLLLDAVCAGLVWRWWGREAAIAGAAFGALAIAIQLGALALMRQARGAPLRTFLGRWGLGMGLRMLGVVAFAITAAVDPVRFPPLPVAVGFLGVLVPLLFFEVRLIR